MRFQRLFALLILTLILGCALSGTAMGQDSRLELQTRPHAHLLDGTWNLRLKQSRWEDDFNQASTTEFRLQADLKYKPFENIHFRLAPQFTYTNGFTQTEEEIHPTQAEWGVKEASVNLDFTNFKLSAGALDQNADHPSVLLSDQAFPALRLKLQSSEKASFMGALTAETAIPTSSSLSTQTKEFEKTPSFSSASGFLALKGTPVEGLLRAGVYQFQDLPMSVASKSTLLGNTTFSSTGSSDSEFTYQYQGTFAQGKMTVHLTRTWRILGLAEWIQNSKAPSGLNQGTRALIATDLDLPKAVTVSPFYEYFRMEPDAAVALYNNSDITTNRAGYLAGASLTYRKLLKVTLSGGERDALYTTPFQVREKVWNLKLETLDVAI